MTKRTLVMVMVMLAVGCGKTKDSRYYNLTADVPSSALEGGPLVGINSVSMPDYLTGFRIVVQADSNRVEFEEYERWVGALDEIFERTLVSDLVTRIPSQNVMRFPWSNTVVPAHLVTVRVFKFNLEADGDAVLEARWELRGYGSLANISTFYQRLPAGQPADDKKRDFDAMAAAMSKLMASFADEIAAAIRAAEEQR